MSGQKSTHATGTTVASRTGVSEKRHDDGPLLLGPSRPRMASVEDERRAMHRIIAEMLAKSPLWAFTQKEAAARLGVSVDFFETYVEPEVRCVKRGRRRLFPIGEILYWLWRSAD